MKIKCPKCNGCGEIQEYTGVIGAHEKYCFMCSNIKLKEDFYKDKKGNPAGYCKKCRCTQRRASYKCICKKCGKEYDGHRRNQSYCSRACYMAASV